MERKSLSALTALTLLGTGATHPAHSEAQQPIPQIASHEGHTPIAVAVPLDTYVASQSSETELLRLGERMRLKLTMSGPFEVAFATPLFKQRDPNTVMVSSPRKLIHLSSVDAYIMKVSSPEDISFLLDSNPAYIQDVSQDSIPLGMNPDVEELIRAPQATKRGATGSGWNIATIDTGVDPNHPELSGRITESICIVATGCANGQRIDRSPHAASACYVSTDNCVHGTATASLAAEMSDTGQIVYMTKSIGDVAIALDDLIQRVTLPTAAVSMSLAFPNSDGTIGVVGSCTSSEPLFEALFRKLVAKGIPPFIATGNNSYANGTDRPACITLDHAPVDGLISVGASTKDDQIADFSNRDPVTNFLVAPGEDIVVAEAHTRGYVVASGTSLSAPIAAAAGARLRGAFPYLTPPLIENLLTAGGVKIDESFMTDRGVQMSGTSQRVDMFQPVQMREISQRPHKQGRLFLPHMRVR